MLRLDRFEGKYAALIAMISALLCYVCLAVSPILYAIAPGDGTLPGPATDMWVLSLLFMYASLIPYAAEGLQSLIRAIRHRWGWKDTLMNILLTILITGLFFFLLVDPNYGWCYVYFGILCAAESVSLIPYYKYER